MNLKIGNRGAIIPAYLVFLFSMVIIIYIFVILIFEIHTTSRITTIKKDLFYISQNCSLALDKERLEYNEYVMNDSLMRQIVTSILSKNYNDEVTLDDIKYDANNNTIFISVYVKLYPIINITKEKYITKVSAEYKLKLMGAENE